VIALDLTGPSLAQFSGDVLSSPARRRSLASHAPAGTAVAAKVTTTLNPITNSPVTVFGPADSDRATVAHGPGGALTRVVPIA
jgi:hypothetical protein